MGPLACLLSAVGFGLMAVLAKLAYDDGVGLDALLLVRFSLAGLVLVLVARLQGRLRGLGRRAVVTGLLMGAVGYVAQAGLYLAALTRVEASQVTLVFCVYPLLVMAAAVLLRRERATRRRAVALAVALVGVALVLGGAGVGGFDPVGAALSLGSAVVYTAYILVGDRVAGVDPIALAALVCCGATGTLLAWSALRGAPDLGFSPRGWLWLVLIALVSTVAAIIWFFAGLAQVGPSVASLLSLLEPVVTVASAALVLGEALTPGQAVGGVLVLASVGLLQWPVRARHRSPVRVAGWSPHRGDARIGAWRSRTP
jgi:drug/metabolite transporter (DMT)-like permease